MRNVDSETRLQLRMHATALAITVLLGSALILVFGLTMLDHVGEGTASLAGLGIAAVSLCTGYGVALYRLFRETR